MELTAKGCKEDKSLNYLKIKLDNFIEDRSSGGY